MIVLHSWAHRPLFFPVRYSFSLGRRPWGTYKKQAASSDTASKSPNFLFSTWLFFSDQLQFSLNQATWYRADLLSGVDVNPRWVWTSIVYLRWCQTVRTWSILSNYLLRHRFPMIFDDGQQIYMLDVQLWDQRVETAQRSRVCMSSARQCAMYCQIQSVSFCII